MMATLQIKSNFISLASARLRMRGSLALCAQQAIG
jgi:hypothetical protein